MERRENKSERLYVQLRRRIGGMKNGELFPTVRSLMSEYKVSQATVTPAWERLKQEGFLVSRIGRGTVVKKEEKKNPLLRAYLPAWPSPGIAEMERRLKESALRSGFAFHAVRYDYREKIETELDWRGADVLVIDSISVDQITRDHVRFFAEIPVPVILCRFSAPVREINYVCIDNVITGGMCADYLVRMGHRRVGLLFNEPHVYTSQKLAEAFRRFAAGGGVRITELDCGIQRGEKPDAAIHEFMNRFAAGEYDFTALFTVSKYGAERVKYEADRLGLKIPEDLSVLSNGDYPPSPWLTAVDDAIPEQAETMVGMAGQLLNGTCSQNQIDIPFRILERGSVTEIGTRGKGDFS